MSAFTSHQTVDQLPYDLGDLQTINSHWLTLTNRCNIHCTYCFNYLDHNNEDMQPEIAHGIIANIYQHYQNQQPLHIIFFGGEPTLNRDALLTVLNYLQSQQLDYRAHLMTNGIIHQAFLEELLSYDMIFQISFDGFENNVRLSKTGISNTSSRTVETIQQVSQANSPVFLRVTIHEGNVDQMSSLVQFAADYHVQQISFAPICMFGDAVKNGIKQPKLDYFIAEYRKAIQLAAEKNIHISNGFLFPHFRKRTIPFVWLPDGQVAMTITYASSKIKEAEIIIFGRFDPQTQSIILDRDKIALLNQQFLQNRERYCHGCKLYSQCQGLNNFSAYATNSFVSEREWFFCELARQISSMDRVPK